jgi:hypothetical protein
MYVVQGSTPSPNVQCACAKAFVFKRESMLSKMYL